jgi:hypothetical protein
MQWIKEDRDSDNSVTNVPLGGLVKEGKLQLNSPAPMPVRQQTDDTPDGRLCILAPDDLCYSLP